jgi:uncharacterized protein YndB with AHSA1/START domain
MNKPFVIERTLDAPALKIWDAITKPELMKHWYFDIPKFRAEVGFEFQFTGGPPEKVYIHMCKVTEVIKGKKLSYSWKFKGYEGNSFVTFELIPDGNKTMLRLTHTGIETFPPIADFAKANFIQGWTHIIGTSLKDYLEKN